MNEDIYELTPEKRKELGVRELPGSLIEAIETLKSDSASSRESSPTTSSRQ